MNLLSPSLLAFLAVVRRSTVLDAAKDLRITQTAVTQRIKTLEQNLGVTLFLRSRKGMLLTPEGETLLQFCRASSELETITIAKLKSNEARLKVKIGATSGVLKSRVIPKLKALQYKNPQIEFHLIDTQENEIDLLKSGEIDIAYIQNKLLPKEVDFKKVKPQRCIFVSHPEWRNKPNHNSLILNKSQSHHILSLLKHWKFSIHDFSFFHTSEQIESTLQMVQDGIGCAILPFENCEIALKQKKMKQPFTQIKIEIPVSLIWYPRPIMPEYFKFLIDCLE